MSDKTVYIIDDDRIYQFSFEKILGLIDPEIECRVFKNGEEAINHCKEMMQSRTECPKIIFLDLNMPVMDGWDFLDELKVLNSEITRSTSIYIVSSSKDDQDINKAKEYEIVKEYLVKPVNREKLAELVAKTF